MSNPHYRRGSAKHSSEAVAGNGLLNRRMLTLAVVLSLWVRSAPHH